MKHRIVHFLQKYLFNPPIKFLFSIGMVPPGYALLQTTGRKTGKPRRTPVGNGLVGRQFWIVAEHGQKAGLCYGLAGTPARPTCFPKTMHASASAGSRISCRAAPAMPLQSASSAPNCSRFGLIWMPDTSE